MKWRKPVRPGDVLVIDVEMTKLRGKIGKAKGICKVRGDIVSEAEVTFMVSDAAGRRPYYTERKRKTRNDDHPSGSYSSQSADRGGV